MGLAGFGAIRAMQDSLKMNRAQLKKHRKSLGELSKSHPATSGKPANQKKLSNAELAAFRVEIKAKRKKEFKQKLALMSVLFLAGALVLYFIYN